MSKSPALAEERRPRAFPIARFLRACGRLHVPVKLPACLSLGVAGRDLSWQALASAAHAPAQQGVSPRGGQKPGAVYGTVSQGQTGVGRHQATFQPEGYTRSEAAPPGAQLLACAREHEQEPSMASATPPGSEGGRGEDPLSSP